MIFGVTQLMFVLKRNHRCAAALLDNAKNGFVIKTADAIYGSGNEGKTYDPAPVPDTPANRLLGWQRICLLVCFFGPSNLYDPAESFNRYAGRPFVFPVVRTSHSMSYRRGIFAHYMKSVCDTCVYTVTG